MKLSLSADELDEFEGMTDADLTKVIRDSLSTFRAKRAEAEDDETPEPDVGGLRHGAASTATLETQRSRGGNVNPGGAARDSAIQATQAAARQVHEEKLRQDERTAEAAKLISGYGRL